MDYLKPLTLPNGVRGSSTREVLTSSRNPPAKAFEKVGKRAQGGVQVEVSTHQPKPLPEGLNVFGKRLKHLKVRAWAAVTARHHQRESLTMNSNRNTLAVLPGKRVQGGH